MRDAFFDVLLYLPSQTVNRLTMAFWPPSSCPCSDSSSLPPHTLFNLIVQSSGDRMHFPHFQIVN